MVLQHSLLVVLCAPTKGVRRKKGKEETVFVLSSRQRQRQTETETETERQIQRERERERERQRQRDRDRGDMETVVYLTQNCKQQAQHKGTCIRHAQQTTRTANSTHTGA